MVASENVATSKAIQQRTGRTFHVATRVLPERVRRPTYVLYAFFRVADEVVDDPDGAAPAAQRRELAAIRSRALGDASGDDWQFDDEFSEPVLDAFADLRADYGIPASEVETFIDAMEMDVDTSRYETHDDLETYLRGSSVAVAYMMLDVMAAGPGSDSAGPPEGMDGAAVEAARPHAKALGEAFQLTNFLRDVREDVTEYDRIYLPRETLETYGVSEASIRECRFTERFAAAMRAELRRTERLYREGVAGIQYLPADCQFAVLLSAVLYADHHRLVRARGFDTLSATPSLSTRRRLSLVARTWYHWRRTGDPEDAFYAASAVPRTEPEAASETEPEAAPTDEPEAAPTDEPETEVGRRGPVRSRARNAAASL
ncbi:MAG: squalene/phytoene synthase family protein, partial [Halobacterium sp.]